jgi:hypothetical protein
VTGVRFRDDTGWEGRCNLCHEWWPIDHEFWDKGRPSRCRDCLRIEARLRLKELRDRNPDLRARHVLEHSVNRALKREQYNRTARERYARNADEERRKRRERYARERISAGKTYTPMQKREPIFDAADLLRERRRAQKRDYMRRARAKVA